MARIKVTNENEESKVVTPSAPQVLASNKALQSVFNLLDAESFIAEALVLCPDAKLRDALYSTLQDVQALTTRCSLLTSSLTRLEEQGK